MTEDQFEELDHSSSSSRCQSLTLTEVNLRKSLTKARKRGSGRNSSGKITVAHRGGGAKQRDREVEFVYFAPIPNDCASRSVNELTLTAPKAVPGVELSGSGSGQKHPVARHGVVESTHRSNFHKAKLAVVNWKGAQNLCFGSGSGSSLMSSVNKGQAEVSKVTVGDDAVRSCLTLREKQRVSLVRAVEGRTVGTEVSYQFLSLGLGDEKREVEGLDHSHDVLSEDVGVIKPLFAMRLNTEISNIGGKYVRSPGSFATVVGKDMLCDGIKFSTKRLSGVEEKDLIALADRLRSEKGEAHVGYCYCKLSSGEIKAFPSDTLASCGKVAEAWPRSKSGKPGSKQEARLLFAKTGKAGRTRHRGKRPTVRGVARNPVDHPHGGGEGKSSGGRPSVTPWGKPTKGQPTASHAKRSVSKLFKRR